ncbi:hypothetical protein P3T76_010528 [Phytophthora citrophthora]|uniref:Uncharacterized protein n=1 Tax=Phytophthora citrophthora TaxID=4793 RepID=A0AAD9GCG2_9STRA|nr:hypothetical protein P3T76_010528 [Phytophthora citrophthora]
MDQLLRDTVPRKLRKHDVNQSAHQPLISQFKLSEDCAVLLVWTMDLQNEIPVKLSELLELLEDIDDWRLDHGNEDTKCDPAVLTPIVNVGTELSLGTQKYARARPRGKRIRKVGAVPYSTDLQRRRRTELLSLRAEAQELEDRLTKFHQTTKIRHTKPQLLREEQGRWQNVAIIACGEREQAENVNRELKGILSRRLRVFASIEQLLKSCDALKGIDLLSQNYRQPLNQFGTANAMLKTISDSLEQMLLQADFVFPALDSCLTVALRTHQKRLEICGTLGDTCVETISVTPMPCTTSKSGTLLWQQLLDRKDAEPDKLYRFIRASHDTVLEMSFTLLLNDESSKLLCVDAVSAYRKFEEENRFVLVGKTTWKPRTGGLELELETFHWTVIEPSPKHSRKLQSCVVQSCNRLQVKHLESTSATARNMLLTSIGSRLRSFMRLMQMGLLRSATTHP